jgi:serine/threonine protein kinase
VLDAHQSAAVAVHCPFTVTSVSKVQMATAGAGMTEHADYNRLDPSLLEFELDAGRRVLLGTGSYGSVYRARYRGVAVAAKEVIVATEVAKDHFFREVGVHASLRDDHVVEMLGAVVKPHGGRDEYYAVLELLDGSLRDVVLNDVGILHGASWEQRIRWLLEIAKALQCMHTRETPIVHADLKPENVLLKLGGSSGDDREAMHATAKVSDFGLSRHHRTSATSIRDSAYGQKGTLIYMDPCLWDPACPISRASDIYSFGILMWELLTGEFPFQEVTTGPAWTVHLQAAVCGTEGRPPLRPDLTRLQEALPTELQGSVTDVVTACWASNREDRPRAAQVVQQLQAVYAYFPKDMMDSPTAPLISASEAIAPVPAPVPVPAAEAPVGPVVAPADSELAPEAAAPVFDPAVVAQLQALVAQAEGLRRFITTAAVVVRRTPVAHLTIKLDRYDHGPEVSFRNETLQDRSQYVACFSRENPVIPMLWVKCTPSHMD